MRYSERLGWLSEIAFSAIGMNAPGLASTAPAPTTQAGDDATRFIRWIIDAVVLGSTGPDPAAGEQEQGEREDDVEDGDQVFGVDLGDDATSPSRRRPPCRQRRLPRTHR